ncbi:hypothetical protein SE1039_03510 [Staphylococcus equorum]|nr:hypothetical protein SE1039_03510 [Staphylococcus equorum]
MHYRNCNVFFLRTQSLFSTKLYNKSALLYTLSVQFLNVLVF